MASYYNEIDKHAAQWLRNLIKAGLIAPGEVDDRSIEDVYPSDLRGFTQCHFFAGIGVWSYALRLAGWSDDRSVWTGSCPCQPFSSAGKGVGFDDERHLWPAWHHLIKECKPAIVLGEQVASKDADTWIDLVQADMEALGHPFGAVPFPSAGVGAPHIRDRLYWVAHSKRSGVRSGGHGKDDRASSSLRGKIRQQRVWAHAGAMCRAEPIGLADHTDKRLHGRGAGQAGHGRDATRIESERLCPAGGMADNGGERREWWQGVSPRRFDDGAHAGRLEGHDGSVGVGQIGDVAQLAGPVNGFWRDVDWLLCRDGKWRPVSPGTFPLAHGASARVGRLRAYGNAINAEAARIFIESVMETEHA